MKLREQVTKPNKQSTSLFMMGVAEPAVTLHIRKLVFSFMYRAATRLRFNLKEK
jgi:hypothetical protein